MHRPLDGDAGGVADLQTDIMRFMAILSLCLVAIFALVQSIPLAPVQDAPVQDAPVQDVTVNNREPATVAATTPAEVALEEVPAPAEPVSEKEDTAVAVEPPSPETASPTERDVGFTLRFASDSALTHLVARNDIGLYAISEQRATRMSVNRGSYTFWPASVPSQFHEMDSGTVPAGVITALKRSGRFAPDESVRWAVTLPANMRARLNGLLSEHESGQLVIDAGGEIRHEQ